MKASFTAFFYPSRAMGLITAALLISLSSCYAEPSNKEAKLKGKFSNTEGHSHIYLYDGSSYDASPIDSAKLDKDGTAVFTAAKGWEPGYYLLGYRQGERNMKRLVLAQENISVTGDLQNLKEANITGSKENTAIEAVQRPVNNLREVINQQRQAVQNGGKSDPAIISSAIDKYVSELKTLSIKHEGTHAGALATALARNPSAEVKQFFSTSDFTDKTLNSLELVNTKTDVYLGAQGVSSIEQFNTIIDELMNMAPAGSPGRYHLYAFAIQVSVQADQALAAKMAQNMVKEFPKDGFAQSLVAQLGPPGVGVGDVAPDIALENPEGKVMKLSDLRGKVVLLDFWASWCRPCRMENPNVVKAYDKFNKQGFEVFSVSLDKAKDSWVKAIAADDLKWPGHVSDLKFWQSAGAKLYGVNSIPATYLIDKNGVIIAKNLRGPALEQRLTTALKE